MYSINGEFDTEEMIKYNRLKALNNSIAKMIKDLYKGNKKIIDDELAKAYLESYAYTGFIMETETQVKLNYTLFQKIRL